MDNIKAAYVSEDRLYRYWLLRGFKFEGSLDPDTSVWVMLNPSTDDETDNDPTLNRVITFAQREGKRSIIVLNLYAFRATNPDELGRVNDPVGPENDIILNHISRTCTDIICGWGNKADDRRVREFLAIAQRWGTRLWCLGKNKNGSPKHQLYVKSDEPLIRYYY